MYLRTYLARKISEQITSFSKMVYVIPPHVALLNDCPQFESLHKKLTLSLLGHDGAVKSETDTDCSSIQVATITVLFVAQQSCLG